MNCAPARKARIISRASRLARFIWARLKPEVTVMRGHVAGRFVPMQALNLVLRSANAAAGSATVSRGRPSSASKRPSRVSLAGATCLGIEAVWGGHSATR